MQLSRWAKRGRGAVEIYIYRPHPDFLGPNYVARVAVGSSAKDGRYVRLYDGYDHVVLMRLVEQVKDLLGNESIPLSTVRQELGLE